MHWFFKFLRFYRCILKIASQFIVLSELVSSGYRRQCHILKAPIMLNTSVCVCVFFFFATLLVRCEERALHLWCFYGQVCCIWNLSIERAWFFLLAGFFSCFWVRGSFASAFCVCYSLLSSWAYLWPLPSFSSSFWPGFFPLVASFDSCSSKPFLFFSALPPAHTQFLLWKQSVDLAYSPFVALVVVYTYIFFWLNILALHYHYHNLHYHRASIWLLEALLCTHISYSSYFFLFSLQNLNRNIYSSVSAKRKYQHLSRFGLVVHVCMRVCIQYRGTVG